MTPKERAAMQQALEALEIYGEHAKDCPQYPTYTRPQDYPKCDCGFDEAITALREALDHSGEADEMVVGWDRVKPEAIASDPLYQQGFVDGVEEGRNQVAEQAEQEPVYAFRRKGQDSFCTCDKERYEELSDKPNLFEVATFYAAPVRTKDLTNDEIRLKRIAAIAHRGGLANMSVDDALIAIRKITLPYFDREASDEEARAVIAADREKNK